MSTSIKTADAAVVTEAPLIAGNPTFSGVTEKISSISETKTPKMWYVAITISSSLMLVMFAMIAYLVWEGVGVWGLNVPVGWGWAIVNFVFWVGIGHAGTLISARRAPSSQALSVNVVLPVTASRHM